MHKQVLPSSCDLAARLDVVSHKGYVIWQELKQNKTAFFFKLQSKTKEHDEKSVVTMDMVCNQKLWRLPTP